MAEVFLGQDVHVQPRRLIRMLRFWSPATACGFGGREFLCSSSSSFLRTCRTETCLVRIFSKVEEYDGDGGTAPQGLECRSNRLVDGRLGDMAPPFGPVRLCRMFVGRYQEQRNDCMSRELFEDASKLCKVAHLFGAGRVWCHFS